MRHLRRAAVLFAAVVFWQAAALATEKVSARVEDVVIPTFSIAKGSPTPALFEEDSYAAYPRTMLDANTRPTEPQDKTYRMDVLENGLIRVEVLAAVGGRIWRIIDRKTGKDLLWTNDAVKPISVGRRRGWLAGGIEFPFPVGNHGEDTMEPYRSAIRENEDGSATVTVSSFDHFYRFWGSYDITVRPDDARMAITVRLYNPTPVRNRYQIWINAAVKTGDDMQFVFPVNWVAGHGFGGIYPWPRWTDGKTDRSLWKNQEDQLGVFGWNADFMGAYYHDEDYGIVRYCPHSMAEGIKLWTWGTDSRWTREYSMAQGSYNEIQGGRWPTQEMYGWLQPHQMDTWTEYWYPVQGLGGVDQASKYAAMGLAIAKDGDAFKSADVRIYALVPVTGKIVVSCGERALLAEPVEAAAGGAIARQVDLTGLSGEDSLSVRLVDEQGFALLSYDRKLSPEEERKPELPDTISVAGTGKIWDDYKAALSAELSDGNMAAARKAYESITAGSPDFEPAWKARGILLYKQLDSTRAKEALAKAVQLDPADMEALYYLGLAKMDLGEEDAAETLDGVKDDVEFSHVAQFAKGLTAMKAGDYRGAVDVFKEAGKGWSRDPLLWDYMAVAARLAGDKTAAEEALKAAFAAEPLDAFATAEKLVAAGEDSGESIAKALGADEDLYIEVALYYDAANESGTGLKIAEAGKELASSGLYYYQLSYLASRAGNSALAFECAAQGDRMGTDYVFPHRREDYRVFDAVARQGAQEGYSKYYQGTLLYWLGRTDEGLDIWMSLVGRYELPGLYRKVADAYTRGRLTADYGVAIDMYRKAIEDDPNDVEAYYNLDDLYEQTRDFRARGEILTQGRQAFPKDDQLAIRTARYLAWRHQGEEAAKILETHEFHRQHQSWQLMHLGRDAIEETYSALAMDAARRGDNAAALENLKKASQSREMLRKWFD